MLVSFVCLFASSFVFFVCFYSFFSIGVVSLVFFFHKYLLSYFGEEKIYKRGSFDSFFLLGLEIDIPALM